MATARVMLSNQLTVIPSSLAGLVCDRVVATRLQAGQIPQMGKRSVQRSEASLEDDLSGQQLAELLGEGSH